ncbi:hypothetical protein [Actinocatenispora comari]|uniref:Uncharacterized protein n=1 Tax=Actinocatenispora comari TaxID=2807577 RepID=A0A8J4AD99_9ACTN|nr:hypothetical protein [Actinocatenispora comari]GIL29176.1 hypothetical protein NUM_44300 [Actinocatenispora comari]
MTDSSRRSSSRVNIAFTPDATTAAKRLQQRFPFADLVDVARVGTAYALREQLPLNREADFGSANGSNFNVGSVDPHGEMRDLLIALHPEIDEDPYRVIETLMSLGTIALDRKVADGEVLSLRDLIDPSST